MSGIRLTALALLLASAPSAAGTVSTLLHPTPTASLSARPSSGPPKTAPLKTAPSIQTRLKAEALRRILEDRDIVANASLEDVETRPPENPSLRKYSYYASMLVHASQSRTREALTDYRAYAKMVPYIDKADFIRPPDLIEIQGGIWKFRLRSSIQFEDRGTGWIHYRIVAGHFKGLEGDLLFESRGEKGTLVYMSGEQMGTDWPPKFVITKGAEIVFAFTAKRMRSYVEEVPPAKEAKDSHVPGSEPKGDSLPQPRNHL